MAALEPVRSNVSAHAISQALATNRVLRNTYLLLGMTLAFSSVVTYVAVATGNGSSEMRSLNTLTPEIGIPDGGSVLWVFALPDK